MSTTIEWHVRDQGGEMRCVYTAQWFGVGAELDDDQVFRVIHALREPAPAPRVSWWRRLMLWRKS